MEGTAGGTSNLSLSTAAVGVGVSGLKVPVVGGMTRLGNASLDTGGVGVGVFG